MKEIRTVVYPLANACRFDLKVNDLMSQGWQLTKREVLSVRGDLSESFNASIEQILYAELERYIPPFPEEVTV
jgi:hypothetical protein